MQVPSELSTEAKALIEQLAPHLGTPRPASSTEDAQWPGSASEKGDEKGDEKGSVFERLWGGKKKKKDDETRRAEEERKKKEAEKKKEEDHDDLRNY